MDLSTFTGGLAIFKSGMEAFRVAVGLAKDVRELLPKADGDQLAERLEQSERAMDAAEAQLLQGIGFPICHCEKPGTAMLTIGRQRVRLPEGGLKWVQLHECPRYNLTDRAVAAAVELSGQTYTSE